MSQKPKRVRKTSEAKEAAPAAKSKKRTAEPPKNAKTALVLSQALLNDAALRIAAGDRSALKRLSSPRGTTMRPASVPRPLTTPPTAEPPALNPIKLGDACVFQVGGGPDPSYLADIEPDDPAQPNKTFISFNSFNYWEHWFDARANANKAVQENVLGVPQPLTFYPQYGAIYKQFECFFTVPFATVVGGAVNQIDQTFKTISWDGAASLEAVPGIEFSARTDATDPNYASTPRLEAIPAADVGGTPTVLVNEGFTGSATDLPGQTLRPPLWIDFDRPQRAVGLEFGYKAVPDEPRKLLHRTSVMLTAYDAAGNALSFVDQNSDTLPIASNGLTPLISDSDILGGTYTNRIGVADWLGRITSVKLEFRYDADTGQKLTEPQAVLRVWHEAMLPAAVLQGTLAVDSQPNLYPAAPVAVGSQSVNLPANCDHAVVFMRGFKIQFVGPDPDAIIQIGAGFHLPTNYSPGPGGAVLLNPYGLVFAGSQVPTPPWRVLVYYTLLVWDSTQVELSTFQGGAFWPNAVTDTDPAHNPPDPITGGPPWEGPPPRDLDMHLIFEDTLCDAKRPIPRDVERDMCGPLMGVAQTFDFIMDPPQARFIRDIFLTIGDEFFNGRIHRDTDFDGTNSMDWPAIFHLRPDGQATFDFGFEGTILTGRSLRVGPDQLVGSDPLHPSLGPTQGLVTGAAAVNLPLLGERFSDIWVANWFDVRTMPGGGIAWPVVDVPGDPQAKPPTPDMPADVAFVAMEHFEFDPNGPLRILEVELRGERYDGSVIDWQLGLGVSTHTPTNEQHYAFGFPTCGAVVRNTRFAKPQILTQGLEFLAGIVGVAVQASQMGAVINNGNAGVSITNVQRGNSPSDILFDYQFLWRGATYSFQELWLLLPLRLRPGETILIGGTYNTSLQVTPGQATDDYGTITFSTTSADTPAVTVHAVGITNPGLASGYWQPDFLDFSATPQGQSVTQTATLNSVGQSLLTIAGFYHTGGGTGFSFPAAPSSIEPFHGVDIPFTYTNYNPPALGITHPNPVNKPRIHEHLVVTAATNAGYISILLQGALLPPGVFTPPGHKGPINPPIHHLSRGRSRLRRR